MLSWVTPDINYYYTNSGKGVVSHQIKLFLFFPLHLSPRNHTYVLQLNNFTLFLFNIYHIRHLELACIYFVSAGQRGSITAVQACFWRTTDFWLRLSLALILIRVASCRQLWMYLKNGYPGTCPHIHIYCSTGSIFPLHISFRN